MDRPLTPDQARASLDTIERGRLHVIDAIDVPGWYWWGLALGWIALGVIADLGHGWLTTLATFAFGAVHASVAPRVISGRHASRDVSVGISVAPAGLARRVIGGLVALGALTVGLALLAQADGADHPTTVASVVVAVIIVLGGPLLLTAARRRTARSATHR
jgi:hypothetical protein